ncbi:hypothetical protein HF685_13600 [Parasphingorhabdus halotolerans]|uniref:Terminase small subunit n=1 Tax=Parasphingorhabdus halotolerans TaxID=2725558 RepID=A0A6H2DPC8_9SPHN|nr:hypothetical protein HF685_13600 [Parasphingorhabdus halotolerans]
MPAQKPYRMRHDGWTPERQGVFIDSLSRTGCVRDACRAARISSTSAYRIRRRLPEFADSWELALRRARVPLEEVAWKRAVDGRETVIIRKGEEVERRIAPSDSMLALLLKRGDLAGENGGGRIGNRTADQVITKEEWDAGIRFDERGKKLQQPSQGQMRAELEAKLGRMRERWLERNRELGDGGERKINIKTGEGIDQEVIEAVQRFS